MVNCSVLNYSFLQGPFHGEAFPGRKRKQYIIILTIQYDKHFETNFTMIVMKLYAIVVYTLMNYNFSAPWKVPDC